MGRNFARFYDKVMWPLEKGKLQQVRKEVISKAKGRVLEVGAGTGINFAYYPEEVQLDAIEPDPAMRDKSLHRLAELNREVRLHDAGAEQLPFRDNTFDTVIATLVFCTIPDPEQALRELYRVSKPGAEIYFLEHVEMSQKWAARMQRQLTPLWKRLCDGCHLDRHTEELVRQSDWEVKKASSFYNGLFLVMEAEKTSHTF